MSLNKSKAIIKKTIDHVESDIKALKQSASPVSPDNAIGRLSRMEAIADKSIAEANLKKSELRLLKLRQAEKRIEQDEYGECLICGEEIKENRLSILPEVTTCIKCAEKVEK